jgi:hypothetical protein
MSSAARMASAARFSEKVLPLALGELAGAGEGDVLGGWAGAKTLK